MAQPQKNSAYRLLVEGTDDKFAIINLLERNGYDWKDEDRIRPFVDEKQGVDNLLANLEGANFAGMRKSLLRLGIVVDADASPANRWAQIKDRLAGAGICLPDEPEPSGWVADVATEKLERIGIWLMPDNACPGTLEHLVQTLVPDSPLWDHAIDSTAAAINRCGAPLVAKDQLKGALHAWLAWQETPGIPFGTALNARVLRTDSRDAIAFVEWFRRLFL